MTATRRLTQTIPARHIDQQDCIEALRDAVAVLEFQLGRGKRRHQGLPADFYWYKKAWSDHDARVYTLVP